MLSGGTLSPTVLLLTLIVQRDNRAMVAGEVVLKAIQANCPLPDHVNDHFTFEKE